MNNTNGTPDAIDSRSQRVLFADGARYENGATVYVTRTVETTHGYSELYFAASQPKADEPGTTWGDVDRETDIVCTYLGEFTVADVIIDPERGHLDTVLARVA